MMRRLEVLKEPNMTGSIEDPVGVPIKPCISAFSGYRLLRSLYECWEQVRGDKMLPTKRDFERAMLEYPEILPHMVMGEFVSSNEFRALYQGSGRVFLRNMDVTHGDALEGLAPNARQFLADWLRASYERPFITFWKSRTSLPGGAMAENANFTAILSNDDGKPTHFATVVAADKAFAIEIERGGYLTGSGGVDVVPIDIGLGVPDLPRNLA